LFFNILLTVLTNNEFVKVKYKPKPVFLPVRLRRKQQHENFERLHVYEGSCAESLIIYVLQCEK